MRAIALSIVAVSVAVVAGCDGQSTEKQAPPPSEAEVANTLPECPHTWPEPEPNDTTQPVRVPSSRTWRTVNVPEYNDCQKFIVPGPAQHRAYTNGYFAIFAYPDSNSLDQRVQPGQAAPVAFIFAEDEPYPQLDIEHGGNCLYMYKAGNRWRASVRHPTESSLGPTCPPDVPMSDLINSPSLPVHPDSAQGVTKEDYPIVARWDFDTASVKQYIGIACGQAWCTVGDTMGAPPHTHPGKEVGTGRKAMRAVAVKGWYDEQYLAKCEAGTCQPTAVVGTIFPDPGLDDAVDGQYDNKWVRVARVAIDVDPAVAEKSDSAAVLLSYKNKFNFDRTTGDGPLNEIFLCHGDATACLGSNVATDCPAPPDEPPGEHNRWWVKIVNADPVHQKPLFRCVVRRPLADSNHVIGTVRWRWLLGDEADWVRCVEGCCEVQSVL